IDEGPYKLGTFRETLAESTEGTPQFGPERPHVYSDLNSVERDRYNADIRATNILLQRGLRESNYDQLFAYLKQHEAHAKENKMVLERLSQLIAQPTADPLALLSNHAGTTNPIIQNLSPSNQQSTPNILQSQEPSHSTRRQSCGSECTRATNRGGPDNAFDDDVDEQPVQDLALNVDNVFQAEDCDAFDSDVDKAPTAQTMFMANLSSADPITDEARPFY
nr:integrase, catalytic region, zinc finger, CCHC-type, peptidase aspartic, catalytic [Tanacetum cinerariifolium]